MQKQTKLDLADSNIALLGSELDKQVRLHAAETEKMWTGVGQTPGVLIWRIENFHVVPQPLPEYGSFYSGDSYIVLNTYMDEAGTAAYKTVELDDFLNGSPVQFREVQSHESKLFLGLFPTFVVREGGVASGFKHVSTTVYTPRLLQVKGDKHSLVVREVAKSHASMNSGDVFICDEGTRIWQWNGKGSNGQEKNKAATYCRALAAERKGHVEVFDEGDRDAKPFWDAIGGEGPIAPNDDVKDSVVDRSKRELLRVSDSTGKIEKTVVATVDVKMAMFGGDDVYVFYTGADVYVWVGKGASPEEKKNGLSVAMWYISERKLPPTTPISRVLEGGENQVFMSLLDI